MVDVYKEEFSFIYFVIIYIIYQIRYIYMVLKIGTIILSARLINKLQGKMSKLYQRVLMKRI